MTTPANAVSAHIKEIGARLGKLTFREMQEFAAMIRINLATTPVNHENLIQALLITSDQIDKLPAKPKEDKAVYR